MKTGFSNMKPITLTKREFFLVAVLLLALEGYLLVTYLFQPALNNYNITKLQLDNTKTVLDSLKLDNSKKSVMEKQIKENEGKLQELVVQIPPYLSQEEAILLIDSLSKKDMLAVQMINFTNAGVISSVAAPKIQTAGQESSAVKVEEQTAAPATAAPALLKQDIIINYTGTYSQVYNFLSDMEKNLRKVSIEGIVLQRGEADEMTGQMNISLVSYWDNTTGQQPFIMETAPIQGKESPFVPYSGYSENAQKAAPVKVAAIQPDFYLIINNYLDNAPKVILSQYLNAKSQVTADGNALVKAGLTIEGSDGAFTYSYKAGSASKSEVNAIKVRDGKIRMEVLAQEKNSDKDKVAVTLDINNKSGIPFEITVKGDNKKDPRFIPGKVTGNVTIK